MNQSSNGNYIHIDNIDFPNFSRNAANFPNSKGPGPIPKKGCESPAVKCIFFFSSAARGRGRGGGGRGGRGGGMFQQRR